MEVGYCHLIDGQRSVTNNSSRLEKRAPPIALINPLLQVREPEIVRPRGRPQGAENRRAEAFDNSTHRLPSQFERVEMETADAIAPEVERAIHRANTTPGRVGRRGLGRGRGRGGGRGGGGGLVKELRQTQGLAELGLGLVEAELVEEGETGLAGMQQMK